MTTRTLRSWKKQAAEARAPCRRGRKKTIATLGQLLAIAREWRRQGRTVGSRPIIAAMKGVQVRLIREVIAELKRHRRARHRAHVLANRTTVKVHKPGIMVVLDAAKMPSEEGGECIMYRDRGSLRTDVKESEHEATRASDTLKVLNELKSSSRLPLVAGTDNGSPFVAGPVKDFMHENKVVHLRSLPRVPEQNGSAEHAVGEVKGLAKDGITYGDACRILNDCRKRETLNWKTPTEIEKVHLEPCTEEMRNEFYNAAKTAIETAMLGTETAYEKRKAEREAIFQTMERFSLITRIRGHRRA